MRLYVANLTAQKVVFAYLMTNKDGTLTGGGHRTQDIPIGQQVVVTGDLTTAQIDKIVAHHRKYGMRSVQEIGNLREFVGTCYSVDTPVPRMAIKDGIEANLAVLIDQGKQFRQEAAVATSNALETQLAEQGRPEGLRALALEVVEEEPSGGYRTEKPIGEGIKVTRNETEAPRPQRRRGAQRFAA